MSKQIKIVCESCGSEDVLADAYASWNKVEQKWEVVTTFDNGSFCNSCDEYQKLTEEEIN